jgi:hypothetical protein
MRLFFPIKTGLTYAVGSVFRSSDIDLSKIPDSYAGGQVYVRSLFLKLALTITAGGGGATVAAGRLGRSMSTLQINLEGLGRPIVDTVKGLNLARHARIMSYGRRKGSNAGSIALGGGASAAVTTNLVLVGNRAGAARPSDFSLHARAFRGASNAFACATALTDVAAGLASITGTVACIAELEVKGKIEGSNPTTVEEIAIAAGQTDPTIARRDGFLIGASVGRSLDIFASTEQTQVQHAYGDQSVLDRTDDVDSTYLAFANDADSPDDELVSHLSGSPAVDDTMPLVYPARDRTGQKLSEAPDLLIAGALHRPNVATNAYDLVREYSWRRADASGAPAPWFREYASKLGVSVEELNAKTITASHKPLHPGARAMAGRFPSK